MEKETTSNKVDNYITGCNFFFKIFMGFKRTNDKNNNVITTTKNGLALLKILMNADGVVANSSLLIILTLTSFTAFVPSTTNYHCYQILLNMASKEMVEQLKKIHNRKFIVFELIF